MKIKRIVDESVYLEDTTPQRYKAVSVTFDLAVHADDTEDEIATAIANALKTKAYHILPDEYSIDIVDAGNFYDSALDMIEKGEI